MNWETILLALISLVGVLAAQPHVVKLLNRRKGRQEQRGEDIKNEGDLWSLYEKVVEQVGRQQKRLDAQHNRLVRQERRIDELESRLTEFELHTDDLYAAIGQEADGGKHILGRLTTKRPSAQVGVSGKGKETRDDKEEE